MSELWGYEIEPTQVVRDKKMDEAEAYALSEMIQRYESRISELETERNEMIVLVREFKAEVAELRRKLGGSWR